MNTRFLFTHMPPGRLFLITAGPGAVGMLASVLFYMVDGIFIGRYLGETAFAAPALILIVLFPLGLDGLWLNYPLTAIVCAVLSIVIIKRFSKDLLAKAKQKHSL